VRRVHEFMESHLRRTFDRNSMEEAIHPEALATPHTAVHVPTTRNVWPVDELLQRIRPLFLVVCPLVGAAFQCINGTLLGRIGGVAAFLERSLVIRPYGHEQPSKAHGPEA